MPKKVTKAILNKIEKNHLKAMGSTKSAMLYAIKTGESLAEAKARVGHGEWKVWLDDELPKLVPEGSNFGQRQATRYMKISDNKHFAIEHMNARPGEEFNLKSLEAAINGASKEDIEAAATRAEEEEAQAKMNGHHSDNKNDEWNTPAKYIESAVAVMGGIDTDPASNSSAQETVNAKRFYVKGGSSLEPETEWHGRIWLNPPYSEKLIKKFSAKLVDQIDKGNVTEAIVLTNNGVESEYAHILGNRAQAICQHAGRISFIDAEGVEQKSPNKGQIIWYFGPSREKFKDEFEQYGIIWGEL